MIRVGELIQARLAEAPYGYMTGHRGYHGRVSLTDFAMRPEETHEELLDRPVSLRVLHVDSGRRRFHAERVVPEILSAADRVASDHPDDDGVFSAVIAAISGQHVAYRRGREVAVGYRNALPPGLAPRPEGWRPGDVVPVWFDGEPARRRALLAFERPWRYPIGTTIRARMLARNPYGAFVQIAPGSQALLHRSQWLPPVPGLSLDDVPIGEELSVCVCATDPERRRVAVSTYPAEVVARRVHAGVPPDEGTQCDVDVIGVRDDGQILVLFENGAEGVIRVSDAWRVGETPSAGRTLRVTVGGANGRGQAVVVPEMAEAARHRVESRRVGAVETVRIVRHTTHNAFATFSDGLPALVILHDQLPAWMDAHVESLAEVNAEVDVVIRDVDSERGRIQVALTQMDVGPSPDQALPLLQGHRLSATCLRPHELGGIVRLDTGLLVLVPLCETGTIDCGVSVDVEIERVHPESGLLQGRATWPDGGAVSAAALLRDRVRPPSAPTVAAQRQLGRRTVDLQALFGTTELATDDWPHAYCGALLDGAVDRLPLEVAERIAHALDHAETLGVRSPHTLSSAARADAAQVGLLIASAFKAPYPYWRQALDDGARRLLRAAVDRVREEDVESDDVPGETVPDGSPPR